MTSMKNKVIWITGASSGIGEALAYQLNNLGAKIILSARREDALLKVKSNCKFAENAIVLPLDLAQFNTLESITENAHSIFGKIDILVNRVNAYRKTKISLDNGICDTLRDDIFSLLKVKASRLIK